MPETSTLQILIQGGAVAIALVCLYIIYKLVSNHDEHLQGSLNRNTDAWVENAKATTANAEAVQRNTEATNRLIDNLNK